MRMRNHESQFVYPIPLVRREVLEIPFGPTRPLKWISSALKIRRQQSDLAECVTGGAWGALRTTRTASADMLLSYSLLPSSYTTPVYSPGYVTAIDAHTLATHH